MLTTDEYSLAVLTAAESFQLSPNLEKSPKLCNGYFSLATFIKRVELCVLARVLYCAKN
ncbi:hypothetical protein L910_2106 [Vibrio fluvialis PG41]|uniref:Uncharacterized protein n=1 Tax=Vibrio fluvialis PG41 TaxID=1336752 RepID=S7JR37_VIBFL|nr:hypothetical protein L910_2106 [Vibrio fluvialis PG41]